MLMHRFPVEPEDPKSKKKNQKQTQDDVQKSLYIEGDGTLVQPSTHIIGTLKRGGAKFQIPGQGKLTYKNLMGSGAVVIDPDMIPHEIQKWEIDRRPVVVQRARVVRSRPVLKEWALNFRATYDDEEIPAHVLKEILDYAGLRVGIGDFRPEKGGPFGRFMVSFFEKIK